MQSIDFARLLNYAAAMILSLTLHEAAHAYVAALRGDHLARDSGRLTLNPLAHIDWFGTLLLPLLGALSSLPIIGWAKPVPVDTRNLRNPKWDYVLVAAAGPLSNLLLSSVALALLFFYAAFGEGSIPKGSFFYPLIDLLGAMVQVNIFLAIFNLLPIPPLDGATVFGAVLPEKLAEKYHAAVGPYGTMLLIVIIASGGLHWLPGLAQRYLDLVILGLRTLIS